MRKYHLAARKSLSPTHGIRRWLERLEERAVPTTFNFPDFSTASSLNFLGRATVTGENRLWLTPAQGGLVGSAWYQADKPIVAATFQTTFQFQLAGGSDGPGGTDGSDGFAVVIQNAGATELGGTPGFLLDNAQVHTASISYVPGTLRVYLDNLTPPVLTVALDLATKLELDAGRAWIGFTAATGGGYQNHDILSWSFQGNDNVVIADKPAVVEGPAGATTPGTVTVRRIGNLAGQTVVNWSTAMRRPWPGSIF